MTRRPLYEQAIIDALHERDVIAHAELTLLWVAIGGVVAGLLGMVAFLWWEVRHAACWDCGRTDGQHEIDCVGQRYV